jgi:hypothetical protein
MKKKKKSFVKLKPGCSWPLPPMKRKLMIILCFFIKTTNKNETLLFSLNSDVAHYFYS